jgi:hypothetical protein
MYNDKCEKGSVKFQLKKPGSSKIPLAGKNLALNCPQEKGTGYRVE